MTVAANNSRTGPPTVADDDVSNALLRRSVDELTKAVEDLRRTVSDYNVLQHRVTAVEKDLDELNNRKLTDRRLVIGAFVAPMALWLFQLFITSRGVL